MPSKNIAAVFNNESNLRILEKLKVRPYYPRELAGEMGLSEPFIVRRLKAMEEYDIVEGKWETEGTRKVKRYYLKDVTLQLGKNGLKVTAKETLEKPAINVFKELAGTILRLPLVIVMICGIILEIWYLVAAVAIVFVWNAAIDLAFYRDYKLRTPFLSAVVNLAIAVLLAALVAESAVSLMPEMAVAIALTLGLAALLTTVIYRSRFYQLEYKELFDSMESLMARLEDDAPTYVKAFYLPTYIRWKVTEYFNLV